MSLQEDYNRDILGTPDQLGEMFIRHRQSGIVCRGWLISDYDTYHQCPYHYNGQRHPEQENSDPNQGATKVPDTSGPEVRPSA